MTNLAFTPFSFGYISGAHCSECGDSIDGVTTWIGGDKGPVTCMLCYKEHVARWMPTGEWPPYTT